MSEILGRIVTISIDGAVVATARNKTLAINNEIISVASDGDAGLARYLPTPGEKAVEVSLDGLMVDETLLIKSLSNDVSAAIVLTYPTFTLTGSFVMPTYSEGLPYKEAITFSASFSSSGAVVKSV
jgi:predicted secreted protein